MAYLEMDPDEFSVIAELADDPVFRDFGRQDWSDSERWEEKGGYRALEDAAAEAEINAQMIRTKKYLGQRGTSLAVSSEIDFPKAS